ncbi:MAG: EamA family transporter RarD [Chitinivibrionales bacterium]|nr:EamA family transporter RarD [Chitinivibrionales bacterium]
MKVGVWYGIIAYCLWGLLPLYWKLLQFATAAEILCHRIIWSVLFLFFLLLIRRRWRWLPQVFHDKKVLVTFSISTLLLGSNWFVYIWAVNAGFVIETSLGYFITPLVNVLLGVMLLKERLSKMQIFSLVIAACGVFYLTVTHGSLPWIALYLAVSFGLYGLVRKKATLGSLEGLSLETLLLLAPSLLYLFHLHSIGKDTFGRVGIVQNGLLLLAGITTATPLLFFAAAARRIQLTTIGFLQFISPSLQFFLGIVAFHEKFSTNRLIGFIFIWASLLFYSVHIILQQQRRLEVQDAPSMSV